MSNYVYVVEVFGVFALAGIVDGVGVPENIYISEIDASENSARAKYLLKHPGAVNVAVERSGTAYLHNDGTLTHKSAIASA